MLVTACVNNDVKTFMQVLSGDNGPFNPNSPDSHGNTALHVTIATDTDAKFAMLKALVAHPDVNFNLKSKTGKTPLMIGIERGRDSAVLLVLKTGKSDLHILDNAGKSVISLALEKSPTKLAMLLAFGNLTPTDLPLDRDAPASTFVGKWGFVANFLRNPEVTRKELQQQFTPSVITPTVVMRDLSVWPPLAHSSCD